MRRIRPERLNAPLLRHLEAQSRSLPGVLNDGGACKSLGWITDDWDDYLRLFAGARDRRVIGEATAAYLWSPTAAANIHASVPGAKIIMILRDPAERAYSQYLHQLSVGLTGATFRRHLQECARAGKGKLSALHPFLEVGMYHWQVRRFLDQFPRSQIRIYRYEEAWRSPAALLADLFRFLGVDAGFRPDFSRKSLERRAPRFVTLHHFLKASGFWDPMKALLPAAVAVTLRQFAFRQGKALRMDAEDRRYLVDYYRDDIHQLAALLDWDLSAWLE